MSPQVFALSVATAFGIFGAGCFWFGGAILREVEDERTDLAKAASPCRQTLRRYQR
jgi:hypothetical protein